jgi:D-alanine--poly(phosphoribitol) ligase subunit 2
MTTEGINLAPLSVKESSTSRSSHFDGVLAVIYECISDLNLQLPMERRIEKSSSTVLFGAGGKLDSMGLANFIVIAEQKLEECYGFHVNLTADDPFSLTTGHFRTLHSLATYISELTRQNPDASR